MSEPLFAPGRADPDLVTLFKGWACLSTAPAGDIPGGLLQGFSAAGTPLIDRYRFFVDGRAPRCTYGAQVAADTWSGVFIVPDSATDGERPGAALDLTILRVLDDRWTETLTLRNHSVRARPVELAFEWRSPLGPGIATRYRRRFGRRRRAPTAELRKLLGGRAPRDGDPVERSLEIRVPARARVVGSKLILRKRMPPRSRWTVRLDFIPGPPLPSPRRKPPELARVWTGNEKLNRILERATTDLEALVLPGLGDVAPPGLSAGVPRYIGVFGRDLITAAWQASLLTPRYVEDALARAAMYQGVKWDRWRDEEPGRVLHESRANPEAALGRSNREIYYGDVAATPFWVVTLASAYLWNGDRRFLARHADALEACVLWIQRKLREGGGFVYYDSRSSEPNRNQGWKDSEDAIVDARGRVHAAPLAVAEVQGYCFLALLGAAEVALAGREWKRARGLYREAMELRARFNRAFWLPREKFFAMALDGRGKAVDGIGSNAGHCLGCGIVDGDKAPFVARRLLKPDLFSGWGIRTLSTSNPAYDPFSYHRGSVWPVENATIAAGLRLTGFHEEAARVIGGQLDAAARFPAGRLPEVLSGHPRAASTPIPGLYPEANPLQAWSASAVLFDLWVLLGLRPAAPLRTLLIQPYLPEWLPWVEVENLRVGDARVSLAFRRDGRGRTSWKVLEKKGRLLVLEQPLELDPAATVGRRLRDLLRSVI